MDDSVVDTTQASGQDDSDLDLELENELDSELDEDMEFELLLQQEMQESILAGEQADLAPTYDSDASSADIARRIVDLISDKKGEEIVLLDLEGITSLADFFVIGNANSERQLNAITDHIRIEIKKMTNRIPMRVEGNGVNGWVLVDYGDVIVHLFSPETRTYYDLEGLWQDANVLLRVQ